MLNRTDNHTNPEAILLIINQEGFCIRVNSVCHEHTGYLPGEIIGKRFKDLLIIQSEILVSIQQKLSDSDDKVISFEAGFKSKGGTIIQFGFHIYWSNQGNELICTGKPLQEELKRKLEESHLLRLKTSFFESLWQTKEPDEIFENLCRILVREAGYSLAFVASLTEHGLDIWYLDSAQKLSTHQLKRRPVLGYLFEQIKTKDLLSKKFDIEIPAGDMARSLGGVSETEKKLLTFPLTKTETSQWILAVCQESKQEIIQQEEDFLLSVSTLVFEALDNIQKENKISDAEEALKKYIKELNLLVELNNQILIHNSEPDLIKGVLDVLIDKGGYRLAWLMFYEKGKEKEGVHVPQYYSGQIDYAKSLRFDLNDPNILRGPTATSMLTGKTTVMGSAQDDPDFIVWKNKAREFGLNSSISFCIDIGENKCASLCVYSGRTNSFDAREIVIIERFKHNLAFGISRIRRIKHSTDLIDKTETLKQSKENYLSILNNTFCIAYCNLQGEILKTNKLYQNTFLSSIKSGAKQHPLLVLNESADIWKKIGLTISEKKYFQTQAEYFTDKGKQTTHEVWVYNNPEEEDTNTAYIVLSWQHTAHAINGNQNYASGNSDLATHMRMHLRELKQITSQEISHEFHKLQAMSELISDLEFEDDELKSILSHTGEIFNKTDQALRHLVNRITEPLQSGFLAENTVKKTKCIIIDADKLNADINYKILSKLIPKESISRFDNFDSALSFLNSLNEQSVLVAIVNANFPESDFEQFTQQLREKMPHALIVLMAADIEDSELESRKTITGIKATLSTPLSRIDAERIHQFLQMPEKSE